MATNTYELKEHLYNSTATVTPWNVAIKNNGPRGIVSKFHNGKTQFAKISTVAFSVSKLLKMRLGVSRVSNQAITYIEYYPENKSSNGTYPGSKPEIIRYMVDVNTSGVKITCDNMPSISEHQKGHRLVTVILASIYYNPGFCEMMKRNGFLQDETEIIDKLNEISNGIANNQNDSTPLFVLCDSFYYQTGIKLSVELEENGTQVDMAIKRLEQNGALVHDNDTPDPVLLKPSTPKSASQENQPDIFTEPLAQFFERCKKGEFIIQYAWQKEIEKQIVPLDYLNSFIPTECFRNVLLSTYYQINNVLKRMKKYGDTSEAIGKNPINIKIMGKPGTGKTTVIEAVLASLGYPKGMINCKGRMEEDEIEGQNKFVKGSIWSIPTNASKLHPLGGAIVLEEFNLPDSDILQGALGQALAYPFILKGDGYQELKRHPLTIYFATMNIGTNGTKPVNQALSSRFAEGHILEDVKEEEFVEILHGAGYRKKDCKMVYGAYKEILNYLRVYHEELVMSLTLRHCLNALDKISMGFLKADAYRMTFISELYANDPDVAEDVLKTLSSKVL